MKKLLLCASLLALAGCAVDTSKFSGEEVPLTFICMDESVVSDIIPDIIRYEPPVVFNNGRPVNGTTWKLTTLEDVDVYYVQQAGDQCWVYPSRMLMEEGL